MSWLEKISINQRCVKKRNKIWAWLNLVSSSPTIAELLGGDGTEPGPETRLQWLSNVYSPVFEIFYRIQSCRWVKLSDGPFNESISTVASVRSVELKPVQTLFNCLPLLTFWCANCPITVPLLQQHDVKTNMEWKKAFTQIWAGLPSDIGY